MTNEKQTEIVIIDETTLQSKIHTVRGQKVMLDFELAEIYGYTTKAFNQQVKNNEERFDEDFRFKLTREEVENLRSKNLTSSWGGSRYLPYAFTEQGIYMLMTVLKSDLAIRQSKALIRTFKRMKDYIIENQGLIGEREYLQLSMQVTQNVLDTLEIRHELNEVEDQMAEVVDKLSTVVYKSDLSEIMTEFGEPQIKRGYLILNGNPFRADVVPNLSIQLFYSRGIFHDRYIILDYDTDDEKIYLCGGSSKDAGGRITSILEDPDRSKYDLMIKDLLKNNQLILK
ncbi:MAG: ORF6N domain-containing protein [Roseburia sp.]|nr:ORF6N domain-containing protein [Roseburia sp.]